MEPTVGKGGKGRPAQGEAKGEVHRRVGAKREVRNGVLSGVPKEGVPGVALASPFGPRSEVGLKIALAIAMGSGAEVTAVVAVMRRSGRRAAIK